MIVILLSFKGKQDRVNFSKLCLGIRRSKSWNPYSSKKLQCDLGASPHDLMSVSKRASSPTCLTHSAPATLAPLLFSNAPRRPRLRAFAFLGSFSWNPLISLLRLLGESCPDHPIKRVFSLSHYVFYSLVIFSSLTMYTFHNVYTLQCTLYEGRDFCHSFFPLLFFSTYNSAWDIVVPQ